MNNSEGDEILKIRFEEEVPSMAPADLARKRSGHTGESLSLPEQAPKGPKEFMAEQLAEALARGGAEAKNKGAIRTALRFASALYREGKQTLEDLQPEFSKVGVKLTAELLEPDYANKLNSELLKLVETERNLILVEGSKIDLDQARKDVNAKVEKMYNLGLYSEEELRKRLDEFNFGLTTAS
jgi:hypothetical protein